MSLKKIFSFFALVILLWSALLTPAMAMPMEKESIVDERPMENTQDAMTYEKTSDEFDNSNYIINDEKTDIVFAVTDDSTTKIDNTTVSGYILRPNGDAVSGATVILGTPNDTTDTDYCSIPEEFGSNQTSTTTDTTGFYILSIDHRIPNAPCTLSLEASQTDYVSNSTNLTIDATKMTTINVTNPDDNTTYEDNYTEAIYPDTNLTLRMHANITAAITTDLPNDPYSNYGQDYHALVNVTNWGDIDAEDVKVNMTAVNGSTITQNDTTYDISGTSSKIWSIPITSPSATVTETLFTEVNGTDADNSAYLYANNTKTIYVQQQAGGDDNELNITNVSLNSTTIEYDGSETILVNASVWNDGEATANYTTTQYVIKTGNNCSGATSTNFNVTGPTPASYNLTGNETTYFTYDVVPSGATVGNYTICITANATDGNDGTSVESNENYATFTVIDTIAPEITITSPAEGSFTGPSALLSANTSEPTTCRYGNSTAPTNVMTAINSTHFNASLSGLTNGSQTYYVNCTDMSGNTNQENRTWNVDAEGPVINLTAPASDSVVSVGTLINFTINDSSNISAAWYSRDSGANFTTNYSGLNATEYYSIDTTGWTEGNHTIVVWANDTFGNVNDTVSQLGCNINITVNGTGPTIDVVSPVNDTWYSASILLRTNATDDFAVKEITYDWTNGTATGNGTLSLVSGTAADGVWSYILPTSNMSEGSYNFTFTAKDYADNTATEDVYNVSIDHTSPNLTITAPLDGANITSGSITFVNITVNESGSGINSNASCALMLGELPIGTIAYNNTTNTCEGSLSFRGRLGIQTLNVSLSDNAGNIGKASINVLMSKSIGGGGGGGGGGPGLNETPDKIDFNYTIEPDEAELLSNETVHFTINIKNVGEAVINDMIIKTYDLAQGDYYTDPKGITLFPDQEGTLELFITPNSLSTGIYKIKISIGNDAFSKGDVITLTVTNAEEIRIRGEATSTCNDAEAYIMSFKAEGLNTSNVEDSLAYARTKISEGNYTTATDICNEILSLTAANISAGITPAGNPFTGFFINTFGPFIAGNLFWILIAAGIVLTSFLARKPVSGWLAGFKKKGKNGKGGAGNGKPAVKESPKPTAKPEAPKAAAPKPEEKKTEVKEPPKQTEGWKIEWR